MVEVAILNARLGMMMRILSGRDALVMAAPFISEARLDFSCDRSALG